MNRFRRFVIIGLLSVSLALTGLTAFQTGTAEAAPRRGNLGAVTTQFVKEAAQARDYAMNQSGSVMNYTKMRTAFASASNRYEVSWRRQMAAGARQAGTRITNISSAELREVDKIRARAWPCRVCRTDAGVAQAALLRNPPSDTCGTGVSKYQSHSPLLAKKWRWSQYFNSCESNDIVDLYTTCALWVGVLSAFAFFPAKAVGAAGGVFSTLCTTQAVWVGNARDDSDLKALIMRTGYVNSAPKGGSTVVYEWFPQ